MVPVISLIISAYNQERWALTVLRSVAAQQLEVPFEVLVCDDGSAADHWRNAIQQCLNTATIDVRYLWHPDRGFRLSRSRNNGIRCSQGELLVFVDGDTWLSPQFLSQHFLAHITKDLLVCGVRKPALLPEYTSSEPDDGRLTEILEQATACGEQERQRGWIDTATPWMACLGGNFSVRRAGEVYFDELFEGWGSEDRDLAIRLFKAGNKPVLLPKANAVHLRIAGDDWCSMRHDQIVAFLHNKVILARKYDWAEISASVSLVRHCQLSQVTNRWSIHRNLPPRSSAQAILNQFERWLSSETGSHEKD
jgi:glycosyltransferase involved in cell wall biosynthesis